MIGEYELDDFEEILTLGEKRFIWLVVHKESKKIAVKKCLDEFNQEIYETISRIDDPHLPKILVCQEWSGKLYVIEEYIAGETLEEKLEREKKLTKEQAVPILIQLCRALECIHNQEKPIIHRDVKLSNIMISSDGIVKLIDYDAARFYNKDASRDTKLLGTEGYAAPEQFGFAQTDVRTDVYAFGVVMNKLLTGCHINEEIYKGKLGNIIKKCIQIDPNRRYRTMKDIRIQLQRIMPFEKYQIEQQRKLPAAEKYERPRKPSNTKLWPIPGFRSRKPWKMAIALLGYNSLFQLLINHDPLKYPKHTLYEWCDHICMVAGFFYVIALVTDYGGIGGRTPMVKSDDPSIRFWGYIIWSILGILIAASISVTLGKIML